MTAADLGMTCDERDLRSAREVSDQLRHLDAFHSFDRMSQKTPTLGAPLLRRLMKETQNHRPSYQRKSRRPSIYFRMLLLGLHSVQP